MTPQEVIKSFMAQLVSDSTLSGTNKLNSAIKASSNYDSIQEVIDAMKADQISAEKEAVEEVLGSSYAGKTISQVGSTILNASAKNYDTENKGNAYYNSGNDNRTTVERLIKERKAIIFLEKYCGIQLSDKYWIDSNNAVTHWGGATTGNVDTGAITGSDANITLTAGDVVNGKTLTAEDLQAIAKKDGNSLSGDTLIVGTGTEKTDRSIVPEIGNKYTATTSTGQNIQTGSNDWIVVATSGNDTILTGGADSVNAGTGNDSISVGADYASILTGAGNDTVEISSEVKDVMLGDLNSNDVLKISGTFNVGSAKIEDTILTVTDKTGTRKIRLGNFTNAQSAKINSTTIANWLTSAGINLNNLSATSSTKNISETIEEENFGTPVGEDGGRTEIDSDYKPSPATVAPAEENQNLPHGSANTTGQNVIDLDEVTLESGDLKVGGSKVGTISSEFPNISSFTKNGLTINLLGTTTNASGNPGSYNSQNDSLSNVTAKTFDQLTNDQKTIVAGLFKWWAKDALKLNEESYGIGFNSSTAMVKEIGLFFYESSSSNTLATVWNWASGTGQNTTKLLLNVNMRYYSGISANDMDGTSTVDGAGFLDRTLSHEFTHAVMATNVNYFNNLPKFIKEGMAELTHGIDDERGNGIFKIAYDADELNGSLDLTNTGTGSQSVGDGYSGGYMFLRYFARQAALQTLFDGVDTVPANPLLITGTAGADSIENTLEGATINALGGNDFIYNSGASVSIDAGNGSDTVDNRGDSVSIAGGADNDSIYNRGEGSIIDGGDGDDTIENYQVNVSINAGEGKDSIFNNNANVTIDGGSGDDTINNFESASVSVYGGDGNDSIVNYDKNGLNYGRINGEAGNDTIENYGDYVTINGGAGDDFISNFNKNVTIDGDAGNDSILSDSENVTINGGAGADSIENSGANVSIAGGTGNDFISLGSSAKNNLIQYNSGDGKDTISGFNATSTLRIGDGTGTYSSIMSDNDLILIAGSGRITLSDAATLSTINIEGVLTYAPSGETLVVDNNTKSPVTIGSLIGVVDASRRTKTVQITGNALNNSILGGTGNDTLDGGDGDDTLTGGKGNDIFIYNGGSDVITDYDEKDKISVTGDLAYIGYNISGEDLILNYGGGNFLTIENGAGKAITFAGKADTIRIYTEEGVFDSKKSAITLPSSSGNFDASSSVYSALQTIDGSLTGAIKIVGNTKGNKIIAGTGGTTLNGGAGNDTLIGGAGADVFVYENKSGNDTVENYGAGDKISLATDATLTDASTDKNNNSTFKVGSQSILVKNNSEVTLTSSGGDTIYSGGVFTDSTKTSATLPLTFGKEFSLGSYKNADSSKRTGAIKITGNAQNNSLAGSTGNDTLDGGAGNDTLTGGNGNDIFIYNGGSDVITDYSTSDKISVASSLTYGNYSVSNNDVIIGYGTGNSLTIKDGAGKAITFDGKPATVNVYSADGISDNKKSAITLPSSSGNFDASSSVYSALQTIDGSLTGAIKITGNAKGNKILAGTGGTTLNGGLGNDTLIGGAGADVFVYENKSGNEVIENYGAGDKISLASDATLTDASTDKNNNSTFKVGSQSILVKNNSEITLTSSGGDTIYSGGVFTDSTKTSATLPLTFGKEFSLGSYKNADSSKRTGAIKITGNAQNNSLAGSTGNDTLDGGAGNDTLTGGNGNDIFIYNGGSDVITDYSTSDKISVASSLTYGNYSVSNNDVIIGYGTGNSLTIKDGAGKAITFDGKPATVNVYSADGISDNKKSAITLPSSSGNFDASSSVYSALQTIDGSLTGAIKIVGNTKGNKILAGTGGTTLNGGAGNDTLIGGAGADVFVYENKSGNDTVESYGAGDKISLASDATLTDASTDKNNNSTFKVGSQSILVKNNSEITLTSGGGDTIYSGGVFTDSTKTTATLPLTFGKEFSLGSYKNADSSKRTGAIKITGNAQNNSIAGSTGNDTLDGGAGNDTLTGGNGNDIFIYNGGSDVITDYATGDKISVASSLTYGNYSVSGSDVILNYGTGNSLTIKDGSGKAITFDGKPVAVNVYSAAGVFDSKKSAITLPSSSGNFDASSSVYSALQTIDGSLTGAIKITGNAKGNKIIAGTGGTTLNGGLGNDTLIGGAGADVFVYENKSGNEIVENYGATDKISLTSDATLTDASTDKNNNSTFKVGSQSILVKNNSEITLTGSGGDTIYSGGVFTDSTKTTATLPLTFGKEFSLGSYKNADSSKRTGAIKITGNAQNNSIAGSTGNDTLDGGAGNDTLTGGNGNDIFIYNGGADVITDYDEKDKISVASSLTYGNYSVSNNDVIIGYGTGNSLTIKDGAGKAITFDGKPVAVNVYSADGISDNKKSAITLPSSSENFDATSSIYSALQTIDGSLTGAIKITGNAKGNKIFAGTGGTTLNGGAGNDTLIGGAGADVFVYENKSGNEIVENYGATDKISLTSDATLTDASTDKNNNTTFKIGSQSILVKNNTEVTLTGSGGDTIYSGGVFTDSTKTTATLPLTFGKEFSLGSYKNADSSKRTGAIKITGNAQNNSIAGSTGNDTLDGGAGNDTLTGGNGNDIFIYNGGSDVITDYATGDKISVASSLTYGGYSVSNNDVIIGYGTGNSLTIKDGAGKAITFDGKPVAVNVYTAAGISDNKKSAITLPSSSGNFDASSSVYSALQTIDGSLTGAIKITGNAKGNKILAGTGGTTLNGGAGNDTLIGGAGADVFVYENKSGNDTVESYGAGDKISLASDATLTDASTDKNNNSTFKVGSQSILVKNNSEVTLTGSGGDTIYSGGVFTDSTKTFVKVLSSFNGTINLATYGVTKADAALTGKAVTIQGTASADSMLGGSNNDKIFGDAGNDTLTGGKGNDSLWGGNGSDTFIFQAGDGTDTVMDYQSGELLTILDKNGDIGSFSKSAFNNNTLTLTINGGGSLVLKNVTDSTSFNVNGANWKVSGKVLAK